MYATVTVEFELDDEQVARAQRWAAELDAGNLGSDDPAESYSAALALSRILASDDEITHRLIGQLGVTSGYVATPAG